MKQKILLLATLLLSLTAQANHLGGGELRYEYDGSNYILTLTMLSNCGQGGMPTSVNVNISSASLAASSQVTLQQLSVVPYTMPCPGAANRCTSPSSNLPGFNVYTYTASIVKPTPASDWIFGTQPLAARNSSTNLWGTGSFYVEARLNNLNGENSNAYTGNNVPVYLPVNTTTTTPLYFTDADGDSVVVTASAPMGGPGTPIPFTTGNSATAPFGSSGVYNINNSAHTLALKGVIIGNAIAAYTVSEYRNGTLIASYLRDFMIAFLPAPTSPNYSYPYPTTALPVVYTCPGASGTTTVNFIDSVNTDSVFVEVDTPAAAIGWNFVVTKSNGSPTGSATVSWTTPASFNPATMPYFYLKFKVRDNGCPRAHTEYAALVKTQQCPTDSVWPGDANSDKVANLVDVLAVAVAFGQTGPARPGANSTWTAQWAQNWGPKYPFTMTDIKHGDCDGNGTINLADLAPIAANFGLTHAKGTPQYKTTGAPELTFDLSGLNAASGTKVTIPLTLGSSTTPVSGIYGMAAKISIGGVTLSQPVTVNSASTWFGTPAMTLDFSKNIGNGTIAWAYARTNHMNTNGNGAVATISFTVPPGAKAGDKISLTFSEVKFIDKDGKDITGINATDAEITVPVSVSNVNSVLRSAMVVPNPSAGNATLHIALAQQDNVQVTVVDVMGKSTYTTSADMTAGNNTVTLPSGNIPAGLYTIYITAKTDGTKSTVKWAKQ